MTRKQSVGFALASGFIFLFGCSGPLPTHIVPASTGGAGGVSRGTGGASKGGSSSGNDGGLVTDFGPLGLACKSDSECTEGLICLGAPGHALGNYVPAGGFCTEGCHSDSDCASFEGASCNQLNPNDAASLYCAPPCVLGDNYACGIRGDVACWPRNLVSVAATTGRACIPTCNFDEQCPDGTTCDGEINLCLTTAAQGGGLALGASCDTQGTQPCDSGFCLDFSNNSTGVCSAYCRRGTFPQCGGNQEFALCAWVPEGDEAARTADIGLCALRCRCDTDCNDAALRCEAHANLAGSDYPGICSATFGPADMDCSK